MQGPRPPDVLLQPPTLGLQRLHLGLQLRPAGPKLIQESLELSVGLQQVRVLLLCLLQVLVAGCDLLKRQKHLETHGTKAGGGSTERAWTSSPVKSLS